MTSTGRLILFSLVAISLGSYAAPLCPLPVQVSSCERVRPILKSKVVSKMQSDALLTLLDGGRALAPWRPWPTNTPPEKMGCVLPVPPYLSLMMNLTNGAAYHISFSHDADLIYLPGGLFEPSKQTKSGVQKILRELDEELKNEVLSEPKPFTYTVGIVEDGGTLSGVARLFYGDAKKWKYIYDANRKTMKNPDMIEGQMKLVIPNLSTHN